MVDNGRYGGASQEVWLMTFVASHVRYQNQKRKYLLYRMKDEHTA
jgi:hypothetical protein